MAFAYRREWTCFTPRVSRKPAISEPCPTAPGLTNSYERTSSRCVNGYRTMGLLRIRAASQSAACGYFHNLYLLLRYVDKFNGLKQLHRARPALISGQL